MGREGGGGGGGGGGVEFGGDEWEQNQNESNFMW